MFIMSVILSFHNNYFINLQLPINLYKFCCGHIKFEHLLVSPILSNHSKIIHIIYHPVFIQLETHGENKKQSGCSNTETSGHTVRMKTHKQQENCFTSDNPEHAWELKWSQHFSRKLWKDWLEYSNQKEPEGEDGCWFPC